VALALAHRAGDGSLPSGRQIGRQYGRHERWGRLVKRAGAAGEFTAQSSLRQAGATGKTTESRSVSGHSEIAWLALIRAGKPEPDSVAW
jgi:hypothetical protein